MGREIKTEDNFTQTCVTTPRNREDVFTEVPRETRAKRIRMGGAVAGGLLALHLATAAIFPQYKNDVKYVWTGIKDFALYESIRGQDYVVKEGDTFWDLATREVEGRFGEDYRGYHREHFINHLYFKNVGMSGMNPDTTLVEGGTIRMKDIDRDGDAGY